MRPCLEQPILKKKNHEKSVAWSFKEKGEETLKKKKKKGKEKKKKKKKKKTKTVSVHVPVFVLQFYMIDNKCNISGRRKTEGTSK